MNTFFYRALIVFGLLVLTSALLYTLPSDASDEEDTQKEKGVISSLFVSGSDEKPPEYQSLERISLQHTLDSQKKPVSFSLLPKNTSEELPENIKTEDTSFQKALKEYGNAVGKLHNFYLPETLDEVLILSTFTSMPDNESAYTDALALSKRYGDLGRELELLVVPDSVLIFHNAFATVHIEIENALKKLLESELTEESIHEYNKAPQKYIESYLSVAQYLRAHGIYFNTSEPGSLFTLPF